MSGPRDDALLVEVVEQPGRWLVVIDAPWGPFSTQAATSQGVEAAARAAVAEVLGDGEVRLSFVDADGRPWSPPGSGAQEGALQAALELPDDLEGEHVDPSQVLPAWWPRYGPPSLGALVAVLVLWQVASEDWLRAALWGAVGLLSVLSVHRSRHRRPTTTVLTPQEARVLVHGRAPRTVPWAEVTGVRLSTRRVAPQLLVRGGTALSLPGLSTARAERLALWLAESGCSPLVLEVDGRRHQL